jgi:IMP dehydrogenase
MGIHMFRVLNQSGGTGVFHRFGDQNLPGPIYNDSRIIPSIGVDKEPPQFAHHIDTVVIDVAHGHHQKVKWTIEHLNDYQPTLDIIAGNVATPEGAIDLIKWGADAIRVGVGGGSVCTTRMKTGVGVPMISCIQKISDYIHSPAYKKKSSGVNYESVQIIADGGMKCPGDICKALAAGADVVMLGSMLAGTDEAPGEIIEVDGQKMKKYYGSASREQKGNSNYVEGISELVPYKGSVVDILDDIKDGLQSSFSYVNASNLEEFHENAELIQVSQNGHKEGTAHI